MVIAWLLVLFIYPRSFQRLVGLLYSRNNAHSGIVLFGYPAFYIVLSIVVFVTFTSISIMFWALQLSSNPYVDVFRILFAYFRSIFLDHVLLPRNGYGGCFSESV